MAATFTQKADSAYAAEDYTLASQLYSEYMAKVNNPSADMLFNAATCAYKAGDNGHAVVFYKRALRQTPANSRIRQNLAFVESKIEDLNRAELKGKPGDISRDKPSFFESVKNTLAEGVCSNVWAVLGVSSFLLLVSGISLYVFASNIILRKVGFFGAIVLLALSILFNLFAFWGATAAERNDECVILDFKATLKGEPKENSLDAALPLHRGTVLDILHSETDDNGMQWLKVRLNADYVGWIPASSVQRI